MTNATRQFHIYLCCIAVLGICSQSATGQGRGGGAAAGSGFGPGSGGGAGYGMGAMGEGSSGSMSEGGSGGESTSRPPLKYTIGDKNYKASHVQSFRYEAKSYRPQLLQYEEEGMGMDGMGMSGGMSGMGMPGGSPGMMGSGMSMGGAPGGMGMANAGASSGMMPPGMDMGGEGSLGMVMGSEMGMGPAMGPGSITIHAYRFDEDKQAGRARIDLVLHRTYFGGSGMGAPGGPFGGGDEGGMGMASGMVEHKIQSFNLKSLSDPKSVYPIKLSEKEIQLVSDIIRQTVWRGEAVRSLYKSKGQGESIPETEKLLRELLSEQYETQMARQELEAAAIQQRLEKLQDEIGRRKKAKDRVVEVQLGRLLLDAQGLLNDR